MTEINKAIKELETALNMEIDDWSHPAYREKIELLEAMHILQRRMSEADEILAKRRKQE